MSRGLGDVYKRQIADYSEGYYILSFKNGILVEWFKEKTPINNNTAN